MSSSDSSPFLYVPSDRLRFLVEYGSRLTALHRKMKGKMDSIYNMNSTVDDVKRLKEELKTAKQSLMPPSYSLDKRGGDKVIEKLKGIVNELVAVDRNNEVSYKELLEDLEEMKGDHLGSLDSQKQASVGSGVGQINVSQALPYDANDNPFEKLIDELSPETRDRLVQCIPLAKAYIRGGEKDIIDIPRNLVKSKGLWINLLIGLQIVDDPLEGEQFLAELVAEPSFNLMRSYSSSKVIVSSDFIGSIASLSPDTLIVGNKYDNSASLINVNKTTCMLYEDEVIFMPTVCRAKFLSIVHLGNFDRGMGHVVVNDTFVAEFDRILEKEKHITFLSLQGISRIQVLPHSVCNFVELRVLDLRSCQDLKLLPEYIGNLVQLICLDLSECYQLDYIPKGIVKLINLRVLLGFVIVTHNQYQRQNQRRKDLNHQIADFQDIKHLTKLDKLTIRTRRLTFPTDQDITTLNSMQELRKLKVAWVRSFEVESNLINEIYEYKEGIPKTLEKLELQAAPETTVSRFLGLLSRRSCNRNLEKIYIRGGDFQKLYSDQHCFPHVKILRLRYLPQLHMNWHDLQLSFPNLSYLQIAECPNLNFFPCDENGEWIKSNSSW